MFCSNNENEGCRATMTFSRIVSSSPIGFVLCAGLRASCNAETRTVWATNCFPNMHWKAMQKYSFSQRTFSNLAMPRAPAAHQMTEKQCGRGNFWSRLGWFPPWCVLLFRFVLFAPCICIDFGHKWSTQEFCWTEFFGNWKLSDWTVNILCRMLCHSFNPQTGRLGMVMVRATWDKLLLVTKNEVEANSNWSGGRSRVVFPNACPVFARVAMVTRTNRKWCVRTTIALFHPRA